jgi:sugar (pentulose or hexulose) kinase
MKHVLAIDQGTSGTKALVVDETAHVVSIAEVGLRPEYSAGGAVEQDPEALFDSVVSAGRQALSEARVPVAAVALANQGETVLARCRGEPRQRRAPHSRLRHRGVHRRLDPRP